MTLSFLQLQASHQHASTISADAPTCNSHFFSRASLSTGHLHPTHNGVIAPSDHLRPVAIAKWPTTSPALFTKQFPTASMGDTRPRPSFLPTEAISLYNIGIHRLRANEVTQEPTLNHSAWLAASSALNFADFTSEQMALLQHPSVAQDFPQRVVSPLQAGNHETDRDYLYTLFSCPDDSWKVNG